MAPEPDRLASKNILRPRSVSAAARAFAAARLSGPGLKSFPAGAAASDRAAAAKIIPPARPARIDGRVVMSGGPPLKASGEN